MRIVPMSRCNRSLFSVLLFTSLILMTATIAHSAALAPTTLPDPTEARINELISKMTLEEKVRMVGGNDFDTFELPRLGIPALKMTDGPLGVRLGKATAFPAGIALGATFDPDLIRKVAVAIADEARFKGRNVVLGPCVNISRNPFGGRNFESFGEDPLLSGVLAAAYVKGVQSRNVAASVKHFAVNDQEHERMTIDVKIAPRALFEIHLPAFKTAVDAGSWTVMAAYNKINGHYGSENDFLQNKILKELWGFKGLVVSDWGATHSTVEAANHGLDLEMPFGDNFNGKLVEAVRDGHVAESVVDDKVRRILRAIFGIGLIDDGIVEDAPKPQGPTSREHRVLALRAAQESIVLLKNSGGILPLNQKMKRVALIGPNADVARTGGGGSSYVQAFETNSPLEGFRSRLSSQMAIGHAQGVALPDDMERIPGSYLRPYAGSKRRGLLAEYFDNKNLSGRPILRQIESQIGFAADEQQNSKLKTNMSIRWSGSFYVPRAGVYKMMTLSDDGARLFIDGARIINNWTDHGSVVDKSEIKLRKGWHAIRAEYYQGEGNGWFKLGWQRPMGEQPILEAVALAKKSDAAVIFAGLGNDMDTEGSDRPTMELPPGQVELINAVARANKNTIVVLTSGNPLAMGEWIGNVKAVVQSWYAGQEGGLAIADVILGRVNPSGKLPVSFLKRWQDSAAFGNYPGQNGVVDYAEGIFVGYRHHDSKQIAPEFPFGHGLSYTKFSIKNLRLSTFTANANSPRVRVTFDLKNTGSRSGAEVPQVYVGELKPQLPRPVRELKAFRKIRLNPGETKTISFVLDKSAFAYFDETAMDWRVSPGAFQIEVGTSSRQIALKDAVSLL